MNFFVLKKIKYISLKLKQRQPVPGQLNPHENLEILPLNILGILKNKILNGRYGTLKIDKKYL